MTRTAARLAIALAACSCAVAFAQSPSAQSSPVPYALAFEITAERGEAAGFAITHSLVVEKLLGACDALRQTLPQDPAEVLKAWSERNWERLEAAYGYLFYVREITGGRQGRAAGEAFYRNAIDEYEKRSAAGLSEVFARMEPNTVTCAKWEADLSEGRADLDWKPQYTPVLDEIVAFHRSVVGKAKP